MHIVMEEGMRIRRDEFLKKLVEILYVRTDMEFKRGSFRVRGDSVEVFPAFLSTGGQDRILRDDIDAIHEFDRSQAQVEKVRSSFSINSHWYAPA